MWLQRGLELCTRIDEVDRLVDVDDNLTHASGEACEATRRKLHTEAVGHDVLDLVRFVEDDDIVVGQDVAAAAHVLPVEVRVDNNHVGCRRVFPYLFGEALFAARTLGRAGAFAGGHAQRRPRGGARLEVELGAVARLRGRCPRHNLGDFIEQALARSGTLRSALFVGEAELAVVVSEAQFEGFLDAEVVAAALQESEAEAFAQMLLQEREVLSCQLVLQRFRSSGDDNFASRQDGGDEIAKRLSGPRAGLHDEVTLGGDRGSDRIGHLSLTVANFAAAGQRRGHSRERGRNGGRRVVGHPVVVAVVEAVVARVVASTRRPTITRPRSIPSSTATRGRCAHRSKPSDSKRPRLGSL